MNRVTLGAFRILLLSVPAAILAASIARADPAPATLAAATRPSRLTRSWVITDYGAVGDGTTMNTPAIHATIEACSAAGGGRVVVPPGTFLTGPIELRSDIELHLDAGAKVLFSRNFDDYPVVLVNYEGVETIACRSPLWGDHLHDVTITGSGTFDGQGDAWRAVKKDKLSPEQWADLVKSGGVLDTKGTTWFPNEMNRDKQGELERLRTAKGVPRLQDFAPYRSLLRPVMVLLSECRHVTIDGPTFRNSPNWNLHLLLCEDVTVQNATIFNPGYAQNGDGIDLESCRNVLVARTTVNAGDDAICLKSGRDEEGRRRGRPTENVTITDCVVGTGHGGVVIGSEMSGGVRNVIVNNCVFKGTDVGLRFKTTRGRGGVVENISVTNVAMSDIKGAAILFDMYYMIKSPQPEPVSERTPVFRQFYLRNITCQGAGQAMQLRGLPELPIERITVEGVRIAADKGIEIVDAKDIVLRDVRVEVRTGPALTLNRVENLATERLNTLGPAAAKTAEPTSNKPKKADPSGE